jgi:hypothetical protein
MGMVHDMETLIQSDRETAARFRKHIESDQKAAAQ